MKSRNNYRHLGIESEDELDFALSCFEDWELDCGKKKKLIGKLDLQPFDCLLELAKTESDRNNITNLINSAIKSNKFITCVYDKEFIENFRQIIYGEDNKVQRDISQ